MARVRLSSSGSRVGLVFVVILIGAIAAANCTTTSIENYSNFFIQIFDVTNPAVVTQLAPNSNNAYTWSAPADSTGKVPDSHITFMEYYIATPNTTANATQASGNKNVVAIALVQANATITYFTPTGASSNGTTGRIGLSVTYT